MKIRTYLAVGTLMLLAASLACANTGEADTGGNGGGSGDIGPSPTPLPAGSTMSAAGVEGRLFIGQIQPPEDGFVALFVHEDFVLDMLAVHSENLAWSAYMTGTLEGQRIDITEALDRVRGSGRPEGPGFEVTVTIPGQGLMYAPLTETEDAGLYRGELNDLIAGLMVLSDGSIYGIAAVEGGDEPVYEYLCVDGGVEGLPDEITATTCDTGVEVQLTKVN